MSTFVSRRTFGYATAAMALKTAATILSEKLFTNSVQAQGLREMLALGEPTAFAQSSVAPTIAGLYVTVMVGPKLPLSLLCVKSNTNDTGVAATPFFTGAAAGTTPAGIYLSASSAFPNMQLAPWAEPLAAVQDKITFAIGPCVKAVNAGNHEVDSIRNQMAATGSAAYVATQMSGALLQANTATNSTVALTGGNWVPGGNVDVSYTNLTDLSSSYTGAVAGLKAPSARGAAFIAALDNAVAKGTTQYRSKLSDLGSQLATATSTMAAAAAVKPTKPDPTSIDVMMPAILAGYNPLLATYAVLKPLMAAGLLAAPVFAITSNDSNGGGGMGINGGGNQLNGVTTLTEVQKIASLYQFIAQLYQDFPSAVACAWGDGGRTDANGTAGGDNSTTPFCLWAPTGSFAPTNFALGSAADLTGNDCNTPVPMDLANGQKQQMAYTANWLSTSIALWSGSGKVSTGKEIPGFSGVVLPGTT